jgi:hypothetical protein
MYYSAQPPCLAAGLSEQSSPERYAMLEQARRIGQIEKARQHLPDVAANDLD